MHAPRHILPDGRGAHDSAARRPAGCADAALVGRVHGETDGECTTRRGHICSYRVPAACTPAVIAWCSSRVGGDFAALSRAFRARRSAFRCRRGVREGAALHSLKTRQLPSPAPAAVRRDLHRRLSTMRVDITTPARFTARTDRASRSATARLTAPSRDVDEPMSLRTARWL